jgi:nitrate reductase gamma subunit
MYHHVMVTGFALTVASTLIAALYHRVFAVQAPYPIVSLPVLAGTMSGLLMLIGTGGLLLLERRADREPSAAAEVKLNVVFLLLLALTAASRLAQDLFRSRLDQIIDLNHPLASWRGRWIGRFWKDSSARCTRMIPAIRRCRPD